MKKSVYQHCTNCQVCPNYDIKTQQLKNEHFSSQPQPIEFIAMNLIGEFHPASSKGNKFTLTAVCMLTGVTFCIPLKSKRAEDVIKAYIYRVKFLRCSDIKKSNSFLSNISFIVFFKNRQKQAYSSSNTLAINLNVS